MALAMCALSGSPLCRNALGVIDGDDDDDGGSDGRDDDSCDDGDGPEQSKED